MCFLCAIDILIQSLQVVQMYRHRSRCLYLYLFNKIEKKTHDLNKSITAEKHRALCHYTKKMPNLNTGKQIHSALLIFVCDLISK